MAFVISDFAKLGNSSNKGISVEVAGRPESINKGLANYVLSEAMQIIDFFADYFDVPYPLAKSSKTKFTLLKRKLCSNIFYFQIKAQVGIPDFNPGGNEKSQKF